MTVGIDPDLNPLRNLLQRHEGMVYVIGPDDDSLPVKIGFSRAVKKRLRTLCDGSPVPLDVIAVARCPQEWEAQIHQALQASRSHRGWFRRTSVVNDFIAECKLGQAERVRAWLSARGYS